LPRIDDFQKMAREGCVLGIHLELDAGRQKGKALEQALDIGVGAFETFHPQARSDLGVFLGEFRAHFPKVPKLVFVVFEQPRIHEF
jgi:hypothetical protein